MFPQRISNQETQLVPHVFFASFIFLLCDSGGWVGDVAKAAAALRDFSGVSAALSATQQACSVRSPCVSAANATACLRQISFLPHLGYIPVGQAWPAEVPRHAMQLNRTIICFAGCGRRRPVGSKDEVRICCVRVPELGLRCWDRRSAARPVDVYFTSLNTVSRSDRCGSCKWQFGCCGLPPDGA